MTTATKALPSENLAATQTLHRVIGTYGVAYDSDEACDKYNWQVVDLADGTIVDEFEAPIEAVEEAERLVAADRAERLREELGGLLDDCDDVATLEAVKALLTK